MMNDPAQRLRDDSPSGHITTETAHLLFSRLEMIECFYVQAKAEQWGLSRQQFAAVLQRGIDKRFASGPPLTAQQLQEFLGALHLEDLALACACAEGCEAAWEHFVAVYRSYLRASAAAILRCGSGSPEASEFADSLFADLYGLGNSGRVRRSLFQYFHGRSSLKTWLRAVLAQRNIDRVRSGRRWETLDDDSVSEAQEKPPTGPLTLPADPHRERYVLLFRRALETVFTTLDAKDSERLRLYYGQEKTLAEIGRLLGEHESSVSRNLDRIRRNLRERVEEILRCGSTAVNGFAAQPGLSEAEISLCLEYAAEDVPLDLEKMFSRPAAEQPDAERPES